METENRQFARREIDLVVKIETADGSTIDAEMLDRSQSGVRLKIGNPKSVPGQFMLRLSDKLRRGLELRGAQLMRSELSLFLVPKSRSSRARRNLPSL